jgi:hypothetical protein
MTQRIQPWIDALPSISTRKLLDMKNSFYSGSFLDGLTSDEECCLYNKIKAELTKRPHIPNKKESKELRKQRKKQGR